MGGIYCILELEFFEDEIVVMLLFLVFINLLWVDSYGVWGDIGVVFFVILVFNLVIFCDMLGLELEFDSCSSILLFIL